MIINHVEMLSILFDPNNLVDIVVGEDRVNVMLLLRPRVCRQRPRVQHEPERLPCLLEKLTRGRESIDYLLTSRFLFLIHWLHV